MRKPEKRFFIRKYMGDDKYSWAVFDRRKPNCARQPVCTGCSKIEAEYHARNLEKVYGTADAV